MSPESVAEIYVNTIFKQKDLWPQNISKSVNKKSGKYRKYTTQNWEQTIFIKDYEQKSTKKNHQKLRTNNCHLKMSTKGFEKYQTKICVLKKKQNNQDCDQR